MKTPFFSVIMNEAKTLIVIAKRASCKIAGNSPEAQAFQPVHVGKCDHIMYPYKVSTAKRILQEALLAILILALRLKIG
jgi:hypothetical protein